ncbi:sigma-70 family RNA polymerase sigma factor [Kitasatospora arboriphila]
MAEEPSDADLLARHVAGDPDAFGLLVRRHRDRLWAVALRTLGDREEAADALQDALVSALRAAHTFQGRSQVTTWLHRIVVNACLDRARRAASRRAGSLDEDPQRLDAALGSAEATDSVVVRAELRREVAEALTALLGRATGRPRPGRHAGIPGRRGGRGAGRTGRHGEESLRPRPGPSAAARPPSARRRRFT